MNSLVWFRVDLRILDNPALYHAIKQATKDKAKVIACCILSPSEDKRHDRSPHQVDFLLRNMKLLSQDLFQKFNIPLLVKTAATGKEVYTLLDDIIKKHQISHLFYNIQYEVDEHRRDKKVSEMFKDVAIHSYHDQMVVPPFTLKSKSADTPYTVYSPYKKAWYAYVHEHPQLLESFDPPSYTQAIDMKPDVVPSQLDGFELSVDMKDRLAKMFSAGEEVAQQYLQQFSKEKIKLYKKNRDVPSLENTSRLSPYLAIGVLSGRQCILKAMEHNNGKFDSGNEGAVTWIQEVLWREFYKHILAAFPRISMNRPFKLETENVEWEYDQAQFQAWKDGKTGYPVVDAAMRELKETGWMHNRMRMVVASFLCKHLLHNWTLGAKHFSLNLIDCDLSSNTSGWLWSASCGNDAQPYFRVFNPLTQAQKFDADGKYIRRWVPELAKLKNVETVHYPQKYLSESEIKKIGYYPRIVEHDSARKKAIAAFENLPKVSQEQPTKKRKY